MALYINDDRDGIMIAVRVETNLKVLAMQFEFSEELVSIRAAEQPARYETVAGGHRDRDRDDDDSDYTVT